MFEFKMPNFGIPDIDKKIKTVSKDPVRSGLEGRSECLDNDKAVFDFTLQWMAEMKEFLAGYKELEIF